MVDAATIVRVPREPQTAAVHHRQLIVQPLLTRRRRRLVGVGRGHGGGSGLRRHRVAEIEMVHFRQHLLVVEVLRFRLRRIFYAGYTAALHRAVMVLL